jgi:hypothetical protein
LSAIVANFILPIFCHHAQDRQPFYARIYLPSHLLTAQKQIPFRKAQPGADDTNAHLDVRPTPPLSSATEEFPFAIDTRTWQNLLLATLLQTPLLSGELHFEAHTPIHWVTHPRLLAARDLNLPPPDQPPRTAGR